MSAVPDLMGLVENMYRNYFCSISCLCVFASVRAYYMLVLKLNGVIFKVQI